MYNLLCVVLLFAICNGHEEPVEEIIDECVTRNGYHNVEGSCDAYIECMDFQPSRMVCPDGLNYNPNATWPIYPCGYPADVSCEGRETSQPAKPTADCPHQYGFFKATTDDCGQYRLCSEGHAYDMYCPLGLAFDAVKARCDWPDLVPGCNLKEFVGFTCPAPEYDLKGNPLTSNYRYEDDCYMFYSCQSGRARLLSCDPGYAFDANVGRCVEADLVDCESDSAEDSVNDVEIE